MRIGTMNKEKLMDRLTTVNIKQEVDDVLSENGQLQNDSKVLSSRHDCTSSNVGIKREFDQEENDLNNSEKQIDNRGQQSVRLSCTKVKKEEGGECKVEWDGDECDCLECRVEREVKIEFNQNNATMNQSGTNLPGPSNASKGASSQCKRVKKEEEHDEEWDEDCDCHQCRRMRLKAIPLKLTNATENRKDLENDGEETEAEEKNDLLEICGDLTGDGKGSDDANEDGDELDDDGELSEDDQDSSNSQISDENGDDETEIDDEEYEMDVDGEESSCDDEETEVDEKSDREPDYLLPRKLPSGRVCGKNRKGFKYICEYCGKQFKKKFYLDEHIRIHTKEKPFKCTWKDCNKEFSLKVSMKRHYMLHTGEKPHKCPWNGCERSFIAKAQMNEHHNMHTGNKPFKCTWKDCSKAYGRHCHLHMHLKYHKKEKNSNVTGRIVQKDSWHSTPCHLT